MYGAVSDGGYEASKKGYKCQHLAGSLGESAALD